MTKRVTLKDIAKEVGVSYQTVSKVLKGQENVSAETKDKIEAAVRKLGYRANVRARNLRLQRSELIGYSWLQETTASYNPVLEIFLQGLIEATTERGYHILTHAWNHTSASVEGHRDLIESGQVDGFILSTVEYDDPRIAFLMEVKFPFVAFGCANTNWDYPYIDFDFNDGMRQVIDHLVGLGHRAIGVVAGVEGFRPLDMRLEGYYYAMQEFDLPVDPTWVVRGSSRVASGYEQVERLLQLPLSKRPTALVCLSDALAVGAMNATRNTGLKVGQDVAITGYDDIPLVEYLQPALTTVEPPTREAGQGVSNLLFKIMNGERPDNYQVLLKPQLIIRESSGSSPD
jgi:DNA-binding LacI/PurR family transcriptional regulator